MAAETGDRTGDTGDRTGDTGDRTGDTGDRTGDSCLGVGVGDKAVGGAVGDKAVGGAVGVTEIDDGATGDRFSFVTILIFVSDGFEAISYEISTFEVGTSRFGWKKKLLRFITDCCDADR